MNEQINNSQSDDEDSRSQAEQRREERRQQRAASPVPSAEQEPAAKVETVPLSVMVGEGNTVIIGEKEYLIGAFAVSKLPQAARLLLACPELLISTAIAASETGQIGSEQTAGVVNRMRQQIDSGAEDITGAAIDYALSTLTLNISEEEAAAMTPLTLLALSRFQPDLTLADIENDLDLETFVRVLVKIFAHPGNRPLRERF